MTIYKKLIEKVTFGKRFKIDLKKQNMRIGNKYLIKDGEWDLELDLIQYEHEIRPDLRTDYCLEIIEELYEKYLTSVPSERSESSQHYFYAKRENELTDEEMVRGEEREVARAALEGFILCSVLSGWLTWNEATMGKWFWQSKVHKDLVILKEWITK